MSRPVVTYKDYVAGWLDSSIHDFLEVLSPAFASSRYALITCLDSNRDPASLRDKSPELESIAREAQVIGTGLLFPTEILLQHRRIFFGFYEVAFFPTRNVAPMPHSASLVGPARCDQSRLNQLGEWMSQNSCSIALG